MFAHAFENLSSPSHAYTLTGCRSKLTRSLVQRTQNQNYFEEETSTKMVRSPKGTLRRYMNAYWRLCCEIAK